MFGNHGLGGLPEEGAPKMSWWEFRGFWGILQRSRHNIKIPKH
ncbi:hypothetical protein BN1095_2730002 [Clostridioides difficile]|uniref:Uncharacterized protein n=1 Tax=Clostridioides difficile TaxID=1496 RepID=A0A069ALD9_CLODI|nr:hypothetical protein BN1095_2730002 [Clostridioides difficile]